MGVNLARTKLVVKKAKNLGDDDYRKCMSLNLRIDGKMRYDLPIERKRDSAHVVLIKQDSKLLAWALVRPADDGKPGREAQFYVRKNRRGQGLAKRLMRQTLKLESKPLVYPSPQNAYFFKQYKKTIRYDDYWKDFL